MPAQRKGGNDLPESKKHPQQEETVDWAERLKASMSEESRSTLSIDSTDDDLAALLRAQLAKGTEEPLSASSLDISEFESESEEDSPDESEEDSPDEFEEDYPDESEEDSPDESEEDYPDEFEEDYPDESEEDSPDESEEDYSDESEEDYPDEAEEDYPDESEEDYPDESEEDYPDEPEDENNAEPLPSPAAASVIADELLNGGDRLSALAALDEENTRLLEEEGITLLPEEGRLPDQISLFDEEARGSTFAQEEADDDTYDASTDDVCDTDEGHVARVLDAAFEAERAATEADAHEYILPYDPMQLGLEAQSVQSCAADEEAPFLGAEYAAIGKTSVVTAGSEAKADRHTVPFGGTLYTERMSHAGDETTEERDTDLYLRLGYEQDLQHAREQERVERLRTRADAEAPMDDSPASNVSVSQEYTGRARNEAVERAYNRAGRKQLLRLLAAIMATAIALAYESIPAIPALARALPFVQTFAYPLIAAAWLLLACIPFAGRIRHGLVSLFAFEPARYSVVATAIPVALLQAILSACSGAPGDVLFVGATLTMLAVAAVSELLATLGEERAFSVVSAGKPVAILTDDATPASVAAKAVLPREDNTDAAPIRTVVRTGRLSDYFARTNRYNPYMARLNYLVPATLLAAILTAGLTLILGGDLLTDASRVFAATYLGALPGAYLLAMSLPLCHANRRMARHGLALVGAASIAELADGQGETVIFADGDALTAVNRKEITLRDDPEIDRWRYMAAEVFHLINSPLAVTMPLPPAALDDVHVEIAETGEGCVKLYLIGSRAGRPATRRTRQETPTPAVEVLLGTHDALVRRGVRLPKASMEQAYKKSGASRVLYLAFDRRFHLAYAAEYRPTRAFAHAVATLADTDRRVALYTYDPTLTPSVLDTPRMRALPRVELLRPAYVETRRGARSAALVCTEQATDIVLPLVAARSVRRGYTIASILSWVAFVGSVCLCGVAAWQGGMWLLSSATVTGWQILWSLLAAAGSLLPLRGRIPKLIPDHHDSVDGEP